MGCKEHWAGNQDSWVLAPLGHGQWCGLRLITFCLWDPVSSTVKRERHQCPLSPLQSPGVWVWEVRGIGAVEPERLQPSCAHPLCSVHAANLGRADGSDKVDPRKGGRTEEKPRHPEPLLEPCLPHPACSEPGHPAVLSPSCSQDSNSRPCRGHPKCHFCACSLIYTHTLQMGL